MFTEEKDNQSVHRLVSELKTYVNLQKEYAKLEIAEKLTIIFSAMMTALMLILLGMVVLFYLSISLAGVMAPYVGGIAGSYAIIAGFVLLLIIILLVFRKKIILNPIARFLGKIFMNSEES
jgi:hypothetical protein